MKLTFTVEGKNILQLIAGAEKVVNNLYVAQLKGIVEVKNDYNFQFPVKKLGKGLDSLFGPRGKSNEKFIL